MPDESKKEKGTGTDTPLHAYAEGGEEDVEGSIPDGDEGAEDVTKTGGGTSGSASGTNPAIPDHDEEGTEGERGLGSAQGAVGGARTASNPDPSTKGADKGTEGAR